RLAEGLGGAGFDVVVTREPGGAPGAEEIRRLLVEGEVDRWDSLSEALLHNAARNEHLQQTVHPALQSGSWVVCDRFADSTIAYQGYGQGLDLEVVRRLHRLVVGGFSPDLTIILDLPVEIGLKRAVSASGDENRYERMGVDFLQRLRDGFLEIAAREEERCQVIDARGTIDEVSEAVRQTVSGRLGVSWK
ncbi:MAG: dTMP kinase, partial [Rhodospirillales bacterium]